MPNHVRNVVKFEQLDEGKTVDELLQEIHGEKENQYISFNKIIPMPEELDTEAGSKVDISAIVCRVMNGEKTLPNLDFIRLHIRADDNGNWLTNEEAAQKLIDNKDVDLELGKTALKNEKKYGYQNWYNWRMANWSTKWDAYDQRKVDENTIAFNTAWSDPTLVIEKLAKDNPHMRIVHKYADECPNFVGHTVYEGGEKVYDQIYYDEDEDKINELYEYCWKDMVESD